MSIVWTSRPRFVFWGEGHVTVSISLLYLQLCSLLSQSQPVTVSRPCCLLEFYTNRASRKVWYSGYQDFKLPCTTYIQLLDSGGSRGGACSPPLFIFRPRLKKNFFVDWAPQLSQDLDGWTPPYLKVWICHCLRGGWNWTAGKFMWSSIL